MTSDQLKTVILEAVDCLRQRKCRPDRESIAVYVMRKLGSSMNEIFSEIENIVDQGELLKVEYKGSTSYRSPKSFDLKNSPLLTKHSKILNSSKTTRYVISGMNELLSAFPSYAQEGVPYEELKKKLLGFDQERFAEANLKIIFEREEAAGNIQAAQSGEDDPMKSCLEPIRLFPKDIQVPDSMKAISFTEDPTPPADNKKKKRVKKTEEGNGKVAGATAAKAPAKKKKKEEVVYAVKSTPVDVAQETSANSEEGDDLKAKTEQINSIGLKVMAGKAAKNQKAKKDEIDSIDDIAQLDKVYDRKSSLALVQPDDIPTEPVEPESEGKDLGELDDNKSGIIKRRKREPVISRKQSPMKNQKQKSDSTTSSISSENDSDDQFSVSQVPPRFTYSARRRVRSSFYDDNRLAKLESQRITDHPGSPNGHSSDICAYCRKEENAAGQAEEFLSCGSCNCKIHPTCIDYSEDHAQRLRLNSTSSDTRLRWQCFTCKRCGVCHNALMSSKKAEETQEKNSNSKRKEERYVLCDRCDRGYHANCINRNAPAPVSGNLWYCSECEGLCSESESGSPETIRKNTSGKRSQESGKGGSKKKGGSQLTNGESGTAKGHTDKKNGTSTEVSGGSSEVPDISSWTPSQVQKYFTEKGLKEEATSLREQEIDGMSLLLLRRADIIFGLNLRLGPALKIFRLVCQLQQHSSVLKKKGGADASKDAKSQRK